jgi:hypothetical protein
MQMQDKQKQPQSRPPIKMADTPDYIGLYIADLVQMRAQGKSHGEMLSWLRTKRVDANLGDVVAFWQDYDKKQKEQHPQPETTVSKGVSTTSNGEEGPPPLNASGGLTAAPEVPMLWDYILDLVTLRGVGKSDDEILDWLVKTKRLYTCAKEIANALDYFEKCQEEIQEDFEQTMVRDLDEERDQAQDQEQEKAQGDDGSRPESGAAVNQEPNENSGDTQKPNQPADEEHPPMASGSPTAGGNGSRRPHTPADFDISAIMDRYKVVVDKQVAKDEVTANLDPESRRITQRMISTLIMYKHSLERREERMMALKIKTEELELKKSKAAAAASQEEEEANETAPTATPAQKKAPKDFDNTALIELMRRVYFKDVDALLASGLVDELIVAAKNKAKAAGAQVEEYVPPPLGTGLWSKPAPASAPAVSPTQAAASSGIPSAIAQQATAEATGAATVATPADVMARINAFLAAYAKKEAASSSGIPSAIARRAMAEAQQSTTQPAKPGPTTTGTTPAINPSG